MKILTLFTLLWITSPMVELEVGEHIQRDVLERTLPDFVEQVEEEPEPETTFNSEVPLSEDLQILVQEITEDYPFTEDLVYGVIDVESNFDKSVVSHAGAKGLMQIMDNTGPWLAEMVGIEHYDPFNKRDSIIMGTWYLNFLWEYWEDRGVQDGIYTHMLSSYNKGIGGFNNTGPAVTYTDNVLSNKRKYQEGSN